jgi:Uma2 family endonuclease
MAIASEPEAEKPDVPGITRPMTYEEYLASPEEMARYDIIDGWKVYRLYGVKKLPGPTRRHQRIQQNLGDSFRQFERATRQGQVIPPPCDVLITLRPLHARQPDLLFISDERLARNADPDEPGALDPAPELVVEILSPSDRPGLLAEKIADYRSVLVQEVWVVRSGPETVEVLRLSPDGVEAVATYGSGQTVTSLAFPGLTAAINEIFAE